MALERMPQDALNPAKYSDTTFTCQVINDLRMRDVIAIYPQLVYGYRPLPSPAHKVCALQKILNTPSVGGTTL